MKKVKSTPIPKGAQLASSVLESHNLKKTPIRLSVLNIFLSSEFALNQNKLESFLGTEFDRVTLYRTLKSFEQEGIIHRVVGLDGSSLYALCQVGDCDAEHKHDNHLHFFCAICRNTFCLSEVTLEKIKFPLGFSANSFSMTAEGKCRQCTLKSGN